MKTEDKPHLAPPRRPRQKVIFLFATAQRSLGSKLLRCDQLCAIAQEHLGDSFDFSAHEIIRGRLRYQRQLARSASGAIVIFLKHAARKMDQRARDILRRRAAAVCIDYIDMPLMTEESHYFDMHIAASQTEYLALSRALPLLPSQLRREGAAVMKLTHGPDVRITLQPEAAGPFRLGYLGLEINRILPDELAGLVDCLPYAPNADMADLFHRLAAFPMQYAIRGPQAPGMPAKPFTKGMIAAAMGRNLLVNRDVADAQYYLGADYPFFVEDTDPTSIRNAIDRARSLYGASEWQRGLEAMRELREATTPTRIAAELEAILRRLQ